jgi:DNA-binding NarL/FixJ family response regulator
LAIVAVTGSGRQALQLPDSLEPDILLLDLRLPGEHGLNLIAPLAGKWPLAKIIVLTFDDDDWHRKAALARGAADFVSKLNVDPDLISAIWTAVNRLPTQGSLR